jgi:hypothetical protein
MWETIINYIWSWFVINEKKELDVLVVSWGGVGSSFLIEFIEQNGLKVNSKDDTDNRGKDGHLYLSGIKHITHPEHSILEGYNIKKVIFLYDDIYDSVVSLFNRSYQYHQIIKMNNGNDMNTDSEMTFDAFLQQNRDLFLFQRFYENWRYSKKPYPCLFLKGQHMYKHRYQICKFLDLDPTQSFDATKHVRKSCSQDLSKIHRQQLENIYGGFNDFIHTQKDILLQNPYQHSLIDVYEKQIK